MGAQESSRRVTIDNSSDDTIGVVKISESLLHNEKDKTSKSTENLSQDNVKRLWEELVERKKELDEQQNNIDVLLQDAFDQGRNSSPSFVDEKLKEKLEVKEQELTEMRQKTKLYLDEQLKRSADIERQVLNQFNNAVNEMKDNYSGVKVQPVCVSLENHILDCYHKNKMSSLKCSQLVRDYINCVEQTRKSVSQNKGNILN